MTPYRGLRVFRAGHKLPARLDGPFIDFYLGGTPIVLGVVLVGAGLAGILARLIQT